MSSEKRMTMDLEDVDSAIEDGIAYLFEHQYPNGEFCCYIAPDDAMQEWCTTDSCTFATALVASSLLSLPMSSKIDEVLTKCTQFLRYQMMRGGVWNFFTIRNPLFRVNPADIDDTVVISSVLRSRAIEVPDHTNLLLANRNASGLFYTWFAFRFTVAVFTAGTTYWKLILRALKYPLQSIGYWAQNESNRYDVDGVVNANVLYYFGLTEYTQPIVSYLMDILSKQREETCDKWYRNRFSFYYFFSRNFNHGIEDIEPAKMILINRILASQQPNGQLGTSSLDTAFGISTLISAGYCGKSLESAVCFLVNGQSVNGSWPRQSFYYSGPKKAVGWGSEELTTAIALQALDAFRKLCGR